MCHYRSLLVADGFIFNSQQHLDVFTEALPKLINEQCPRDTVDWHLQKAHELIQTKCTVLRYGLELDELLRLQTEVALEQAVNVGYGASDDGLPVVLWNARLEEDKDPEMFLEILSMLKRSGTIKFRLIVLGTDATNGCIWYQRFQTEFADELLYIGFCHDRAEYAKWLSRASIVVSTAQHETFGISIVESVFCGALPLMPHRLSYPELFSPVSAFTQHFYSTKADCLTKLNDMLHMIIREPHAHAESLARVRAAVARFRWSVMRSVYDVFFSAIAGGQGLRLAGIRASEEEERMTSKAAILGNVTVDQNLVSIDDDACGKATENVSVVTKADDTRVALYRPKSLRDHAEYQKQLHNATFLCEFSKKEDADQTHDGTTTVCQIEPPTLHGGRRAMVRMLEAMRSCGARIQPLSFLTTRALADKVLLNAPNAERKSEFPIYVIEKKELLDEIRGQKINAGDAILAMVHFPVSSPLEELLSNPPVLVLEDVRNAENVGSILRTAYCLGITSIVASNTAWSAIRDSRSARCSMGTMYYHKYYKSMSVGATLAKIRQTGKIKVYGIEIERNAKPVGPHGKDRNWAAVMGNEDAGLTSDVQKLCDSIVFVPQAHGDSLNVGHAAAITLFELGREAPLPKHDGSAACK